MPSRTALPGGGSYDGLSTPEAAAPPLPLFEVTDQRTSYLRSPSVQGATLANLFTSTVPDGVTWLVDLVCSGFTTPDPVTRDSVNLTWALRIYEGGEPIAYAWHIRNSVSSQNLSLPTPIVLAQGQSLCVEFRSPASEPMTADAIFASLQYRTARRTDQ